MYSNYTSSYITLVQTGKYFYITQWPYECLAAGDSKLQQEFD